MDIRTLLFLTVSCKIALFQNIVSGVCLDARNITYTVKCNYEQCHIPGQYCDQSDLNFHRCAMCDEDLCNQDSVPGECTIPCLVYSIKSKEGENTENIQNDCFTEDKAGEINRIIMIASLVLNGVLVVALFVSLISLVRKSQGHQTVIDHPKEDVNTEHSLTIATSISKDNIQDMTSAKSVSEQSIK